MDPSLALLGLAAGHFLLAAVIKAVGQTGRLDQAELTALVAFGITGGAGCGFAISACVVAALPK